MGSLIFSNCESKVVALCPYLANDELEPSLFQWLMWMSECVHQIESLDVCDIGKVNGERMKVNVMDL